MKYNGTNPAIHDLISSIKHTSSDTQEIRIAEPHSEVSSAELKKSILIGDLIEAEKIIGMLLDAKINHLIQLSNLNAKTSLQKTAALLSKPEQILLDPVHTVLDQVNENSLKIEVTAGSDKEPYLDIVRSYLKTVPKMVTIRDSGVIISNELLMNILYDAPMYYRSQFNAAKPGVDPGSKIGELLIAYDETKLLIGAKDIFGSLSLTKMLTRLRETFQTQTVAVNLEPGSGAGLGCRMIFDLGTEIYFAVKKQQGTFVGACLPLGISYRKQQEVPKNVHILEIE